MILLNLFICFILPITVFIFLQKKYKRLFKSFLLGALAFFISQIVIRIPILNNLLPNFFWYNIFQVKYPYLYWIFLGLTAGIFEEVFRLFFIKTCMKRNHHFIDSISFGMGHGAIEAMIITGLSNLNLLIYSIMINNGTLYLNSLNLPQATLDTIFYQCTNLKGFDVIFGGIERIIAMGIHIGLTVIIFEGIIKKKTFKYLIFAVLIHTAIDSSIGFMSQMFGFSALTMEVIFGIISLVLMFYVFKAKNRVNWNNEY
jgi:uncharacterized membrane protein YhfC